MFVLSQSLAEEVTLLKIRGNVLGFHPARLAAVGYEGKFDTLSFSHMTKLCRVAVLDDLESGLIILKQPGSNWSLK